MISHKTDKEQRFVLIDFIVMQNKQPFSLKASISLHKNQSCTDVKIPHRCERSDYSLIPHVFPTQTREFI